MRLKKCVLSLLRKLVRVEMSLMSDGSAFHTRGPAMEKALSVTYSFNWNQLNIKEILAENMKWNVFDTRLFSREYLTIAQNWHMHFCLRKVSKHCGKDRFSPAQTVLKLYRSKSLRLWIPLSIHIAGGEDQVFIRCMSKIFWRWNNGSKTWRWYSQL